MVGGVINLIYQVVRRVVAELFTLCAPYVRRVVGEPADTFSERLVPLQILGVALAGLYFVGTFVRSEGHNTFLDVWVYYGCMIVGALLCFARSRLVTDKERRAWELFAVAITVWMCGEVYWTLRYANAESQPNLSLADVGYLAFYPLIYAAVITLVRARSADTPRSVWLDGVVGGLATASVCAALFFQPIADGAEGSFGFVVVNLAYPCADLLLLALVVCSFSLNGWRPDRSWLLLGIGLCALAISDVAYLFETAKGTYAEGTFVDVGWPIAMTLIGLAPWRRPRQTSALIFESWAIVIVPLLFALVALAILSGSRLWHSPSISVILAFGAVCIGFVRLILTFTEVRALTESRREARTDELTGLGNRRLFYESLNSLLRNRDDRDTLALLLIDLDRFKEVNDSLGHQFGDRLLRQIGPRLHEAIRLDDLAVRLGGDEFAVILDMADVDVAVDTARRIQQALDTPFRLDGVPVKISASIGISMFPNHARDANQLLRHADVAMYSAKAGRGEHRIYEPHQEEHTRARLNTINELRDALNDRRLVVHYQPKVTTQGRLAGVEALVRLDNPKTGLVRPDEFLPLAEQAGLMQLLTGHVIDIVLDDIASWRERGHCVKVAVNLSVTNLLDSDFPARVAAALQEHRLPGKALVFEITETTVLSDPARARIAVQRLRSLGAATSLDDYGTGYASIAYLRQMPLNELKLDRSFVSNLESDEVARSFFTSTVQLAHTLGLSVVAEGIETQLMWDAARRAGCDVGQGYFFAKPMTAESLFYGVLEPPTKERSLPQSPLPVPLTKPAQV